jgi:hypothetical protein
MTVAACDAMTTTRSDRAAMPPAAAPATPQIAA